MKKHFYSSIKIVLAGLVLSLVPLSAFASFSDIPESHEYYEAITLLNERGVIGGYADGTFKSDQSVNRVEALKMILGSANITASGAIEHFPDVLSTDWFFPYVEGAYSLGIVQGNPDGLFDPARTVNKAEFIKMTLEAFNVDLSAHQNLSENIAPDVSTSDWFAVYMSYAKTVNMVYPNISGELEPGKQLSRGECAEILYRMILLNEGGEAQKMLSLTEAHLVNVLSELQVDNLDGAIEEASAAVFYSEQALIASPSEGIIIGANAIANGFLELTYAYQASLNFDTTALNEHANNAKNYATAAENASSSLSTLSSELSSLANLLL